MSLIGTEDYPTLVGAVREFARRELTDLDRACDRAESSICTQLQVLYDMGLMGLRLPPEFGGLGVPTPIYADIIRELAYASPSAAVTVAVHNMVGESLARLASPEVQRDVLPRLVEPGNLSAFAISEPDAGSDPSSISTRAEPEDGGWRLYGNKMWVTNGISGRWYIVLARTVYAGAAHNRQMFLVDAHDPAISRVQIKGKMGIRGSETAEVRLEGVFVPESYGLGDGLKVALSSLDGGRISIASQAIGIAQACLDEMTAYARQRRQFGRPIVDFQAIQWMIADSAVEIDAAQLLVARAATMKDAGERFTREASMAKLFASEAANRIAYRAVQIHGGSGYVNDCRVEQLYRDARITTIYEGTSEIQRHVIARELLRGEGAER